MDVTRLEEQLQQIMKLNEELRQQNESLVQSIAQLQQNHAALQQDYEALLASTQTLIEDRGKLQQRVAELEAANKQLVDMLWGRRSERRTISPDQLSLDFGADSEEAPSDAEQAVIVAQQEADEAFDEQLLRDLAARRRRRKEQQRQTQEFPEHIERRERILDLSDEEKIGLNYIGDAVTERMRFEKPTVYIERIVRRKYVVPERARTRCPVACSPFGHCGRLSVRLQHHRGHLGPEVRLSQSDVSSARLVFSKRLVSQSQHDQSSDQLERRHAESLVRSNVAPVAAATDCPERRHAGAVIDSQRAEPRGAGDASHAAASRPAAGWRRATGIG